MAQKQVQVLLAALVVQGAAEMALLLLQQLAVQELLIPVAVAVAAQLAGQVAPALSSFVI